METNVTTINLTTSQQAAKAFCSVTSSVGMTDPQKALERIREISKKMLEGYAR